MSKIGKLYSFIVLCLFNMIFFDSCAQTANIVAGSLEKTNRYESLKQEKLQNVYLENFEISDSIALVHKIRYNAYDESINKKMAQISTPDLYKIKSNGYRDIPVYDINNLPISVWFINKDDRYVGFTVAGHATKAICEIASLEIHNKFKEIEKNETDVFSFGIGHSLHEGKDYDNRYHNIMKEMKEEFEILELSNSDQVKVFEIKFEEYNAYLNLFINHINLAKQSAAWNTHIVEYKLNNFPLIAPFYLTESSSKIQFKVPKSIFGPIPTQLVYASYKKSIAEAEASLKATISANNAEIKRTRKFENSDRRTPMWEIKYSVLKYNEIYEVRDVFWGYRPPPDEFSIIKKELITGKVISERPITFQEALNYLNNPEVVENTPISLIEELRSWKKQAIKDRESFNSRKQEIVKKIQQANKELYEFLKTIEFRKNELKNRDNQDYIIDAFLRGWVLETNDEQLNEQLDNWYEKHRKEVWNNILNSLPNAQVEGRMAGIFHSDDVFFDVKSEGDFFSITPYKVIGGEFIQIIDKKIGISYLQSPFSFRFSQN